MGKCRFRRFHSGLPDGIFSNQEFPFGQIWEGLAMMVDVDTFLAIWYILLPFCMFHIWSFGRYFLVLVSCTKKNLATLLCTQEKLNGYIFKPIIPIWANLGGSCNGRC
jgi:hypothetical protein